MDVFVVTADEFTDRFPQYGPYARGAGAPLFDMLTRPESYVKAKIASDLGHPAVAGVASDCEQTAIRQVTEALIAM